MLGDDGIAARCAADPKPKPIGKTRLLSLADIDRRTAAYRRTVNLISAIKADLGGEDQLSTGERQIIQRAAVTGALIEDLEARWFNGEAIDPALYATLGNAQRRLLETVGLRRRPKDMGPTLADILREDTQQRKTNGAQEREQKS